MGIHGRACMPHVHSFIEKEEESLRARAFILI